MHVRYIGVKRAENDGIRRLLVGCKGAGSGRSNALEQGTMQGGPKAVLFSTWDPNHIQSRDDENVTPWPNHHKTRPK